MRDQNSPHRQPQTPQRPERPAQGMTPTMASGFRDWAVKGEMSKSTSSCLSPLSSMPYSDMNSSFNTSQETLNSDEATIASQSPIKFQKRCSSPSPFTSTTTTTPTTLQQNRLTTTNSTKKTVQFWLIFISLMVVMCLAAIDITIISTALPTIVDDLPKSSIPGSWITSSFLLTTTAFQPFMGGLADVLGRRLALVLAIVFFIAGSIFSALANTMFLLVLGRGIQGIGGGGIQTIVEIIISDITTLRERGLYIGLMSLVFAVASFVAPVLGGFFSQWDWRWVFWINVPIGAVGLAIIIPVMKLQTPEMPFKAKLHRMDIPANLILLASVVGILFAVTDGGIIYLWSNWRIIISLVLGLVGLALFFALQWIPNRISQDPVLPRRLFQDKTAAASFIMTFLHGMVTYGLNYMLPIYFQAIKSASPLRSAVQVFPATAPAPFAAIFAGVVMSITGRYRLQIFVAWAVIIAGSALLCIFDIDTSEYQWILIQALTGLGIGAMFALTLSPIQASVPVEELAHATATFAFCRSFGSIWGIALGTTTFVGNVNQNLAIIPGLDSIGLTGSTALGFTTKIRDLPLQFQEPVREAFMSSLKWSFFAFVPIAVLGFIVNFLVKELPLPDFNESKHSLQDEKFVSQQLHSHQEKGSNTVLSSGQWSCTALEETYEAKDGLSILPSSSRRSHFKRGDEIFDLTIPQKSHSPIRSLTSRLPAPAVSQMPHSYSTGSLGRGYAM